MAPKWISFALVLIITSACLNMLWVLAPGLPIDNDIAQRMAYIAANQAAWQWGWLNWMASALALLLFCFFLLPYIPSSTAKYFGITIVAIGIAPDIAAETLYAFVLPWLARGEFAAHPGVFGIIETIAMQLTGFFGNGAYNVGGLILNGLLFHNAKLPRWLIFLGLPSWILGLVLSFAVAVYAMQAAQILTGAAIVWNVLWMLMIAFKIYAYPQRYKVA